MDEKQKKLNLMKFWLFGSYAIIAAAISAFLFMIYVGLGKSAVEILKLPIFWIFLVGVGVLFIIVFFIYKTVIGLKE
jgi:hypothetical protein